MGNKVSADKDAQKDLLNDYQIKIQRARSSSKVPLDTNPGSLKYTQNRHTSPQSSDHNMLSSRRFDMGNQTKGRKQRLYSQGVSKRTLLSQLSSPEKNKEPAQSPDILEMKITADHLRQRYQRIKMEEQKYEDDVIKLITQKINQNGNNLKQRSESEVRHIIKEKEIDLNQMMTKIDQLNTDDMIQQLDKSIEAEFVLQTNKEKEIDDYIITHSAYGQKSDVPYTSPGKTSQHHFENSCQLDTSLVSNNATIQNYFDDDICSQVDVGENQFFKNIKDHRSTAQTRKNTIKTAHPQRPSFNTPDGKKQSKSSLHIVPKLNLDKITTDVKQPYGMFELKPNKIHVSPESLVDESDHGELLVDNSVSKDFTGLLENLVLFDIAQDTPEMFAPGSRNHNNIMNSNYNSNQTKQSSKTPKWIQESNSFSMRKKIQGLNDESSKNCLKCPKCKFMIIKNLYQSHLKICQRTINSARTKLVSINTQKQQSITKQKRRNSFDFNDSLNILQQNEEKLEEYHHKNKQKNVNEKKSLISMQNIVEEHHVSFEMDFKKDQQSFLSSKKNQKKISGASHDFEALKDIMSENWQSATKRKESDNNLPEKITESYVQEVKNLGNFTARSIVSSIQGDEIEEVQFPEFDIELLSQENKNIEEGSNNSYKSIVVCEMDIDLADVKACPLQMINDGDLSQLENQCPNCCKIIGNDENLEQHTVECIGLSRSFIDERKERIEENLRKKIEAKKKSILSELKGSYIENGNYASPIKYNHPQKNNQSFTILPNEGVVNLNWELSDSANRHQPSTFFPHKNSLLPSPTKRNIAFGSSYTEKKLQESSKIQRPTWWLTKIEKVKNGRQSVNSEIMTPNLEKSLSAFNKFTLLDDDK